MFVYFAPMEGVTDVLFRRVHRRHFGGVRKYFMPFLSPAHTGGFTRRELFDLSPQENAGVPAVPQLLVNNVLFFQRTTVFLRDLGYREVNLNLGCPSGTVTAKGKGSGLLRDKDRLRALLDGIFANPALPVSVKTRIGWESPEEWPALLEIYQQYPISELIVHPRTRREFYGGTPHREACLLLNRPFVYNGDLFRADDLTALSQALPLAGGVMLGRGLVANPALAQTALGGEKLTLAALCSFHDDLFAEYQRYWPETAVVGRMHLIMKYLCGCFENSDKPRRMLRKATTADAYFDAVRMLLNECPFRSDPAFRLDILLS